jgi:hypothetical protein
MNKKSKVSNPWLHSRCKQSKANNLSAWDKQMNIEQPNHTDLIRLSYSLDAVPPNFKFFSLQWANLANPSLKKNKTM